MLPRAALRALRQPSIPSCASHLRHASPIIPVSTLRLRTYASKPPRPPPPPSPSSASKATPRRPPPPPQNFQGATGQGRQTSPGTSFPKDQTWKPKDGIKLGGPAAATVSGAGMGASVATSTPPQSGQTPADGVGMGKRGPVKKPSRPLEQEDRAEEPLARQSSADEPLPGEARYTAQHAQAASENQPPPPQAEPAQPVQPLPDLRQGIPSTFEMEFGQGRKSPMSAYEGAEEPQLKEGQGMDLTYEQSEGHQQRDRGERDYDSSAYETSIDRRRAQFLNYFYLGLLGSVVTGALYLSRPYSSYDEQPTHLAPEDATGWSPGKMYARVRARCGDQLGYYTEPTFPKLLPEVPENQRPPFTLVLSLEDLLIHSSWDREHGYRTAKRPGIDYFVRYLSQYYELVLFTSVPIAMADPVIKKLDPYHFIMWPLGREATKYDGGEYVKDLAYINRPLSKTLIIDTHAPHVKNQPENAIIIPRWIGDPKDAHTKDLVALIPFLEYVATMGIDDVRPVLKSFEGTSIPEEFARREAIAREKFNAQLASERAGRPKRSLGSLAGSLGMKGTGPAPGSMVLADGQSVAEGLREGKMLSDQIREQGQRQYEFLEKQIRENGAQWLKEEEEEQKKMMDAQMKDMKKGAMSWFGSKKE